MAVQIRQLNRWTLAIVAASGISACGGSDPADDAVDTSAGTMTPAPVPAPMAPSPGPTPSPTMPTDQTPIPAPVPQPGNPPAAPAPAGPTPSDPPAPAPATPGPAPTPVSATGAASDCLPRDIFQNTTTITMTTRETDDAGTQTDYVSEIVATPNVSTPFGVMTEWKGKLQTTANSQEIDITFFLRLNGNILDEYGFETDLNGFQGQYELNHSDPRHDLAVNESRTSPKTSLIGNTVDITYTYVGQETVTVPAGTFTACRWEVDTDLGIAGITSNSTEWHAIGNGLPVKMSSVAGDMSELVSASINGQPITGQ